MLKYISIMPKVYTLLCNYFWSLSVSADSAMIKEWQVLQQSSCRHRLFGRFCLVSTLYLIILNACIRVQMRDKLLSVSFLALQFVQNTISHCTQTAQADFITKARTHLYENTRHNENTDSAAIPADQRLSISGSLPVKTKGT